MSSKLNKSITRLSMKIVRSRSGGNVNTSSTTTTTSPAMTRPIELHRLIASRKWEETLEHISTLTPTELRHDAGAWVMDSSYGKERLAIHRALGLKSPLEIIEVLLQVHPDASRYAEKKFGMIPLHIAVQNGCSKDVIELLVRTYPEGARSRDTIGLLPVHFACTEGAPVDVIRLLLEVYPEACDEKDARGRTPEWYAERSFHPHKEDVLAELRLVKNKVFLRKTKEERSVACPPDETPDSPRSVIRYSTKYGLLQEYIKRYTALEGDQRSVAALPGAEGQQQSWRERKDGGGGDKERRSSFNLDGDEHMMSSPFYVHSH